MVLLNIVKINNSNTQVNLRYNLTLHMEGYKIIAQTVRLKTRYDSFPGNDVNQSRTNSLKLQRKKPRSTSRHTTGSANGIYNKDSI